MSSDPSRAGQNPSTVKPSKKEAANRNIRPFITRANNPSVIMVIGKVSINKIGRMKTFSTPNTKAAITAEYRLSTSTPLSTLEIKIKPRALNVIRSINVIV